MGLTDRQTITSFTCCMFFSAITALELDQVPSWQMGRKGSMPNDLSEPGRAWLLAREIALRALISP